MKIEASGHITGCTSGVPGWPCDCDVPLPLSKRTPRSYLDGSGGQCPKHGDWPPTFTACPVCIKEANR